MQITFELVYRIGRTNLNRQSSTDVNRLILRLFAEDDGSTSSWCNRTVHIAAGRSSAAAYQKLTTD